MKVTLAKHKKRRQRPQENICDILPTGAGGALRPV